MSDRKIVYPVFPASCWWPLRNRFKRSMPASVSIEYLTTVLGVEAKTARNLLPTLRAVGLIDGDGSTTERANHWRVDEDYPQVCRQIREEIYPSSLELVVPDPSREFNVAVQWFMKESGVGEPAAKRMARFYLLLSEANPANGIGVGDGSTAARTRPAATTRSTAKEPEQVNGRSIEIDLPERRSNGLAPVELRPEPQGPTHLTIQIQLSPGASPEQIDQLFASIARHIMPGR